MRYFFIIGLSLCGSWPAAAADRAVSFFAPLVPPRSFAVMAHGGLARLAPENTRPAITLCIDDGLEWVEVEVRLTRDNQHVLFGDDRLDGRTSGSGPLKQHTLEDLQKLDAGGSFARRFAGAKILSLDECLTLAKDKINLCLDCRDVDPKRLVDQIKAAGMERQVIVRGDRDRLKHVHELSAGAIAVMPEWNQRHDFPDSLDELEPAIVEIDAGRISADACRRLHARGAKVLANARGQHDRAECWDKALADGADLIKTDLPEELVVHVVSRHLSPRPVKFACHRGASRYAPENTLTAYEKAYRLGADFVEFDVRPTRDGQYYLLHDGRLDRTTNLKGPIRDAASNLVDAADAGSWFGRPFAGTHVPSLDAFLSAVPPGVSLYFDAKDIPPQALAAALAKHGLAERTVVYQGADYLEKLKPLDARIRLMPPARSADQVTALAASLKPYAVDTPWTVVSRPYIDHCHAAGIAVFADAPFYVDVNGYRRAIECGIDLIQTDHPLRVWRAMELVARDRAGR
ncbi:MAG: glycerophosphodiester phosphodiesterase family protein [Pirellulales bacterium]